MKCPSCNEPMVEHRYTEWISAGPERVRRWWCKICGAKIDISREKVEFDAATGESAGRTTGSASGGLPR